MTAPVEPEPGTRLLFRWRKWDGSPHWVHDCVYLGSDEWGEWFGQAAGWSSSRPGREFAAEGPNVTLVPPSGDFAMTVNGEAHRVRTYIDLAWDLRWQNGEPVGIDMDLDVVKAIDGRGLFIDDEDEWEQHRALFGYPADLVAHLESLAHDLVGRVAASEPPFDDETAARWLARLDSIG